MQSGIYHQLFMFFFFHCVSISPVQSHPPTLRFTQGGAQAYTLAVMHTVAASTEELHECTHNCLFFLTETCTLATHSKMAPSVFLSLFSAYKETQLRHTLTLQYTHTHTHRHTHTGRWSCFPQSHLSIWTVSIPKPNVTSVEDSYVRGARFSDGLLRVRSSPAIQPLSATTPTQVPLPSLLFPDIIPDSPHQLSHCITKPDWWTDWKEIGNSCCVLVPLFCLPFHFYLELCLYLHVYCLCEWQIWWTKGLKQLQYTEVHLTQRHHNWWPWMKCQILPAEVARESARHSATTQIRSSVDIKAQLLWCIFNGTSIAQG